MTMSNVVDFARMKKEMELRVRREPTRKIKGIPLPWLSVEEESSKVNSVPMMAAVRVLIQAVQNGDDLLARRVFEAFYAQFFSPEDGYLDVTEDILFATEAFNKEKFLNWLDSTQGAVDGDDH
jgi:hypothetical protein